MRKFLLLALVAVSAIAAGCHKAFAERDALFVAYNTSSDNVVALVNDGAGNPVPANGSARFIVRILVPYNDIRSVSGPSVVDKDVQVSVAFKNMATGKLTDPAFCRAGVKIITTVWYKSYPGGQAYASCTSSY